MTFQQYFPSGFQPNHHRSESKAMYRAAAEDSTNQLTIKIPSRRILRLIARSVLSFLVIASLPWIGYIAGSSPDPASSSSSFSRFRSQPSDDDSSCMPLLFRDLIVEGLIKPRDRAVVIGHGRLRIVKERVLDPIVKTDIQWLGSVPADPLDFVFVDAFVSSAAAVIDRKLKIGGVAAFRLSSSDRSDDLRIPINYKIVYLRRFGAATVVAMRRIRRRPGGSAEAIGTSLFETDVTQRLRGGAARAAAAAPAPEENEVRAGYNGRFPRRIPAWGVHRRRSGRAKSGEEVVREELSDEGAGIRDV